MFDVKWAKVPGFADYQASEDGQIRSKKSGRKPVKLKQQTTKKGYLSVFLCKDGVKKNVKVHRAVLMAFRGPPGEGEEASHLDGCKTNNHINNLIWESRKDNANRRTDHGTQTHGEASGMAKLTTKEVNAIRFLNSKGVAYGHLAIAFHVSKTTIGDVCRRDTWAHV